MRLSSAHRAKPIPEGRSATRLRVADFVDIEGVPFQVVHFNNGMHEWAYSEDEYRRSFPALLASVRAIHPDIRLVWATITPVKKDTEHGAGNDCVNARNSIALTYISAAAIPLDDQHVLMMNHLDAFQDNVHFQEAGSRIQGQQAAQRIRKLLEGIPTKAVSGH